MAILHAIDVARIANETLRGYYGDRALIKPWAEAFQATRDRMVALVQAVLDKPDVSVGEMQAAWLDRDETIADEIVSDGVGTAHTIIRAVVNALRPFTEE